MTTLTQQSAPYTNLNSELTFAGAKALPHPNMSWRPGLLLTPFFFETNQNPSFSALNDLVLETGEGREMPKTRGRDRGSGLLSSLDSLASRISFKRMQKPWKLRIHPVQVPARASGLR